jgi:hypothetical protein
MNRLSDLMSPRRSWLGRRTRWTLAIFAGVVAVGVLLT